MHDHQLPSGRGYGCAAAGIVFLVGSLVVLFAVAWGGAHCSPVPSCQRSGEIRALWSMPVVLAIAAGVGFIVRGLVRWLAFRMRDRSPGQRALASLAILFGSIWATWKLVGLTLWIWF